jgi:hypothetical protein
MSSEHFQTCLTPSYLKKGVKGEQSCMILLSMINAMSPYRMRRHIPRPDLRTVAAKVADQTRKKSRKVVQFYVQLWRPSGRG